MTDIADRLVYSRSALTYQVTRLADARLVTREPADDDERGIVVTVTPQGRAALARALPGHVEVVQRLLMDPLTGPETVTLGDVLGRVRDHARALPPRSVASRRRTPPDRGGAGRASDTQ
jgi:DNA-binding MarR family transcriptional regulator